MMGTPGAVYYGKDQVYDECMSCHQDQPQQLVFELNSAADVEVNTFQVVFKSPDIGMSNGLHVQYALQGSFHGYVNSLKFIISVFSQFAECSSERPQVITPTTPAHMLTMTPAVVVTLPSMAVEPTTDRLSVVDILVTSDYSAMGSIVETDDSLCVDPCPTPRIGCEMVKENEGDCCGEEKCYGRSSFVNIGVTMVCHRCCLVLQPRT